MGMNGSETSETSHESFNDSNRDSTSESIDAEIQENSSSYISDQTNQSQAANNLENRVASTEGKETNSSFGITYKDSELGENFKNGFERTSEDRAANNIEKFSKPLEAKEPEPNLDNKLSKPIPEPPYVSTRVEGNVTTHDFSFEENVESGQKTDKSTQAKDTQTGKLSLDSPSQQETNNPSPGGVEKILSEKAIETPEKNSNFGITHKESELGESFSNGSDKIGEDRAANNIEKFSKPLEAKEPEPNLDNKLSKPIPEPPYVSTRVEGNVTTHDFSFEENVESGQETDKYAQAKDTQTGKLNLDSANHPGTKPSETYTRDNWQPIRDFDPPNPNIEHPPSLTGWKDSKNAIDIAKNIKGLVGAFTKAYGGQLNPIDSMKNIFTDPSLKTTLKNNPLSSPFIKGLIMTVELPIKGIITADKTEQYIGQSLGYTDGIARWTRGEPLQSVTNNFPKDMEERFMGRQLSIEGYHQGIECAAKMIESLDNGQAKELRDQLKERYGTSTDMGTLRVDIREGILEEIHKNLDPRTKEDMPVR